MYKKTSDNSHYLKRTGSHATKGSGRGDLYMDHGADFVNDVDLVEARAMLLEQKDKLVEESREISRKLILRLPFDEYTQLAARKAALGESIRAVEATLGSQRSALDRIKRLKNQAIGEGFIAVARHRLPSDVFDKLMNETKEFVALADGVQPGDTQLKIHAQKENDTYKPQSEYDMFRPGGASQKASRKINRTIDKGLKKHGFK